MNSLLFISRQMFSCFLESRALVPVMGRTRAIALDVPCPLLLPIVLLSRVWNIPLVWLSCPGCLLSQITAQPQPGGAQSGEKERP